MNKVNFDSLKNIKAPESWLEKAAAIPETVVKRHAAFPIYRFAVAASVVLVSVVGLLMSLSHQGSDSVLITPRHNSVATQPETSAATAVSDTEEPTEVLLIGNDDIKSTWGQEYATTADGQPVTESVSAPTISATVSRNTEPSTSVPATQPTNRSTVPTEAQKPTVTAPTTPPKPTAPPATQETTGVLPEGMPYISAAAAFPSSLLSHDDVVYCAIYDHGKLVSQGEASVYIMKNGNVFAEYDTGIEAERGKVYHYAFFGEQTSVDVYEETSIFASGTISYE